ncbi:NYN domain-containing protein, partial [Frankia sp. CNm7]|uniref:NYN domain-containing protein n=1 Tax=Frankia nepalensis TaxID=1836974 RepID=UPI0019321334
MTGAAGGERGVLRVRSALFVDFENIHLGLQRLDAVAANRFAVNPQGWLGWLEKLAYPALGTNDFRRDLLIRYCYLNPVSSARYRAYFTRAGFHVVDCPPLTAAGKNSADIHIVIDVLDILGHPTRFDEVILLSADADYTPVMLRLRAHDRRTVIITSGPSARAFRAACDHVVGEDTFIDDALSWEPRQPAGNGNGAPGGIGATLTGPGPVSPMPVPPTSAHSTPETLTPESSAAEASAPENPAAPGALAAAAAGPYPASDGSQAQPTGLQPASAELPTPPPAASPAGAGPPVAPAAPASPALPAGPGEYLLRRA